MAQASSPVLRWNRDGHLAIAKFPHLDDEINTVRWEAVALSLAKQAAIEVRSMAARDRCRQSMLNPAAV